MSPLNLSPFQQIERATADRYRHPSGVNTFVTIVNHGPVQVRGQIRQIGLTVFGNPEQGKEGNFEALDVLFCGLSSTDKGEYLVAELRRRIQGTLGPVRPVQQTITISTLGKGTPALPPTPSSLPASPKGGFGMSPTVPPGKASSPLGPYRKP